MDKIAGQTPIVAYDFANESDLIKQMQKVSLDPDDHGLAPDPLVGGEEWWAEISSGKRPTRIVEGTIKSVFWGSMGDWPEFRIRTDGGEESTWTREGDISRYAEGLRVRLSYVEHPWKQKTVASASGEMCKVVLRIEIEDSPLRSSTVAPGPGRAR